MSEHESIKPDAINKETLELLQLRLEHKIRGDFLKSVAIPVGGGGLVAIGLAIWVWIPSQVREVFENKRVQDQIERTIQDNVAEYFASESVQTTMEQRIRLQVNQSVDARLADYFQSDDGRELVGRLVAESSGAYFKTPEMEGQVRRIVTDYLNTDGRKLLTETINAALKPTTNALAGTILRNRDRLLYEFEQQSFLGEPKLSLGHLHEFLRAENVQRIRGEGRPVVLTKEIRPGFQYDVSVIDEYLESFHRSFGDLFKHVAIQHGEGRKLLALIPTSRFESVFGNQQRAVMELLNAEDRMSEDDVRRRLGDLFGKDALRAARADQRVVSVLMNATLWPRPDELNDEVAVVDGGQRLLATTTRQRLIDGILTSE
jgi:hypothetical protein